MSSIFLSLPPSLPPSLPSGDVVITQKLSDWTVRSGDSLTHHCAATSVPTPTLVFLRNGVLIPADRVQPGNSSSSSSGLTVASSVTVSNADLDDAGLVQCVVVNNGGRVPQVATSTARVTVISESVCLSVCLFHCV